MCDLFEFPASQPAPKPRRMPQAVIHTHKVTVPSRNGGKDVEYARLSDEDHQYARDVIGVLDNHRATMPGILSQSSGLYGQRAGRRQTYGDVLDGLVEKLRLPHPKVPGRKGEDFSVKQLTALNKIIESVNAGSLEEDAIPLVTVPT